MKHTTINVLSVALLLIFSATGCSLFSGVTPVAAPAIPDSICGGNTARAIGQTEFYDEYSNFYVVAQIGLNWNDPLARTNEEINDLADNIFIQWDTVSDSSLFTKEYMDDEDGIFYRCNEDYSAWETISVTEEVRRHMRVQQKDGYVLGTLFMTHVGSEGATESLEIIETENYTYIKIFRVRNPDGDSLKESNPENTSGDAYFDMYAGIVKNDSKQRSLGVKRYDATTWSGVMAKDHDYAAVGGIDSYMVAAFDNEQYLIRPAGTLPSPLEIVLSSGDSPSFSPEFNTWPVSQSESFTAADFPGKTDVEKIFDLGADGAYASKSEINEDYSLSYPVDYNEWGPSDIGIE